MPAPNRSKTAAAPTKRSRLAVAERREQFIDAAISLFSEYGFSANTRMLADRLGTTQPLLFRYFPSKELLIYAVMDRLFAQQSQTDWVGLLSDRRTALRDRLIRFSLDYAKQVYHRDWIRIYMFAGLADGEFNRRYINTVTEPILRTIASEIRHELGPRSGQNKNISRRELDYLWLFHGGIYYHTIRRHIYGLHIDEEALHELAEVSVDTMLDGINRLLAKPERARRSKATTEDAAQA